MKTRHIIGLALLMTAAGACKKNQEQDTSTFSAGIEVDDSRTHLDGMKVKWDTGDAIEVYGNGSEHKTYTLSGQAGGQTATFTTTGGVQPAQTYRAFYPAANCTSVSGDVFTFTMPATQTYTANGFMNQLNPMAGKNDGSGGTTLGFRNAFAILKVNATGNNCAITSIELTTTGNAYQLSGTFSFDYTNTSTTLSSGTGNKITLSGISTTLTNTAQTFYFVVPPAALADGFTITYKNGTSTVYTNTVDAATVSSNYSLEPNKMLSLTMTVEASGVTNLLPEMVPANWNVSDGAPLSEYNYGAIRGVKFSNSSTSEIFLRPSNPTTVLFQIGHTYYVRFYANMGDYGGTQTFEFFWPEAPGCNPINGRNYIGANNTWKMYSAIYSPSYSPSGNYSPRIDFNGDSNFTTRECRAAGAMLIDLTDAYNKTGINYPAMTQAQLDGRSYFSGITTSW